LFKIYQDRPYAKHGFVHPTTGEMMRFDTELPQDFRIVLKNGEDTLKQFN
jgi:23S rRNA pseudouridine1911/1915/1917 synthase